MLSKVPTRWPKAMHSRFPQIENVTGNDLTSFLLFLKRRIITKFIFKRILTIEWFLCAGSLHSLDVGYELVLSTL